MYVQPLHSTPCSRKDLSVAQFTPASFTPSVFHLSATSLLAPACPPLCYSPSNAVALRTLAELRLSVLAKVDTCSTRSQTYPRRRLTS
jgi:hypothetical protein